MTEKFLTVEEAAKRLGVSTATVKRRARDGSINAVKSGRNWVIYEDGLPVQPANLVRRAAETASALVDLPTALQHLKNQDLGRDIWIPDVLRFADDLINPTVLRDEAAARIDNALLLAPATPIPVPKSPIFLRNAVNLALPDRLAYHAVVLAMAPTLDALIGEEAYAARLGTGHKFLKSLRAFARWKSAVRAHAEAAGGYVIETDVTAFFDCINHTVLMREVRDAGVPAPLANTLSQMLKRWQVAPNTGLPQGPDASRLLANFYMRAIDDVMTRIPGIAYFRYMDDVRIIASTRHLAISALHEFDDECKKRNLVLSTKKTELKTAAEAIKASRDSDLNAVKYAFDTDETSTEVRKSLSALFRGALKSDGTVNATRARFSLYRLFKLREKRVLRDVLKNLETVAGLGWNVAAYIAPWITAPEVGDRLADYFEDPERNTGGYLSSWLLAAIADEPTSATPRIVDYARTKAFDSSTPSSQRAIAMQVAAIGRTPSDIAKLQAVIDREYDPEVVRGALVALRRIDKLDRSVTDRARRIAGMQGTVDYLRQSDDLPSMIFGELRARRVS